MTHSFDNHNKFARWVLAAVLALSCLPVSAVTFFQSGGEKFDALLADMRQAKHHIHAEYFIFANDSIANLMLDVMRQKASEGVEVRLVVDGYYDKMRQYNHRFRMDSLRASGIDFHIYNPYVRPYLVHNLRSHRKIVVIDGRIGYTGGFNVADYNICGKPGVYGSYIDTHVRLEGEAEGVNQLQQVFAEHYEHCGGKHFEGEAYYPEGESLSTVNSQLSTEVVVRGRWDGKKKQMRRAVVAFIDSAQEELHIQSPYILPTPAIRRALRRAIRRGVKVKIMYSEKGDTPIFNKANPVYTRKLQRRGAEVWLYQDGFQHSKVLTADGKRCMVGSMNLDLRAMRWNEEVAVIIDDAEATAWLDNSFAEALEHCRPMDEKAYKELPRKTRISGRLVDYFLGWCL